MTALNHFASKTVYIRLQVNTIPNEIPQKIVIYRVVDGQLNQIIQFVREI